MTEYNSVIVNPSVDSGEQAVTVVSYTGSDTQYVAVRNDEDVYFQGHTSCRILVDLLSGESISRFRNLAIRAINNRTRERNFARLCDKLSSGEIDDRTYESLLEEDSDEYIIKCDVKPTEQDLKMAASLAPDLMDVSDTDDLAILFSFDETEIRKFIGC